MHEMIEKLLILQDRDRRIRQEQGELSRIEPERQTLKAKAATAQAELENAKLRIKQIESARKDLELEVEGKKQMIVRYSNQQFQTRKTARWRTKSTPARRRSSRSRTGKSSLWSRPKPRKRKSSGPRRPPRTRAPSWTNRSRNSAGRQRSEEH